MDQEGNNGVSIPPESNIDGGGEAASVGQKRPMGEGGGLGVSRPTKRLKNGVGEMQEVAEMVLLLSAMGQMRGGRAPTDAEVKLMAEAREKLVEMCQNFAPKELVPGHVIGKVIDDLGLNWKLKDQRLGFRGSRLSIKEKVSLAKRKMEEPKKFTTPGTHASQTSNPSFPTHTVRSLPLDKLIHAPLPSGSTVVHPPFTHVSATPSVPVTYLQASNVEVKGSAISMGLPYNQAGSTSAVAASKTQFVKMEGGPNGNTYTAQANASVNHPLVNAPTWSLQPNSLSKMGAESKVPTHAPVKAEGIADTGAPQTALQTARDHTVRPFITQTTSNMPSVHQSVQTVKSVYSTHNGIARTVQKLLQPKLPQYPTWIPPSREYMNKALSCQSCILTINEVETVAICDACEKGFHLKCLESAFQKGIPRTTEWHCMKCTSLSNGKPFPPKYGRVMRSMTPPKGLASATHGGPQSFSDKKLANMVQRGNHEKMSSVLQSVTESGTPDCSNLQSASGTKISSERGTPRDSITSMGKDTDMMHCAGTLPNDSDSTKPQVPIHYSAKVTLSGDTTSKQIQAAGSPILDSRFTSEPKLDHSDVASAHALGKHESKSQNNMQDAAQAEPLNNVEGSLAICQAGTIVEESRKTGGSSPLATVSSVKQSAEGDVQPSLLLRDDTRSEGGVSNAPDSKHDAKQSDQGDIHPHCASGPNSNQSEHGVDHAPASKHDVRQSEQVVACGPSASDHNVVQGILHTPFASEQYVKQNEQGVTCVPSVPDHNVKQSEQEVNYLPDSENNVEQNQQGVVHAPSASGNNVEQSEQVVASAPFDAEHNVEESEKVVASTPCVPSVSGHNVKQSEQEAGYPPDSEHNVEQNQQGVVHALSASDHNVEQSEQVVASAPSDAEHNVEQIEKDVACASSDPEHHVEQKEHEFAHAPSVSEHNVEQSEQSFVHAPGAADNNVQLNEEDVSRAPSGSEHYVEQAE